MRIVILLFWVLLGLGRGVFAQDFFDQTDAFLETYIHDGRVDYQAISSSPDVLASLMEQVRAYSLEGADENTKKAFLINAYNLIVMQAVTIHYPITSVMEVPGFFDQKKYQVAGSFLTLNELEKEWLLDVYGDPRLHFVLVCGAVDCPPIISEAYRPASVEEQLDRQTALALGDPMFIRIDESKQRVMLSEIFKWYVKDFGGNEKKALAYINSYRQTTLPEDYGVGYYIYDWLLNDVGRRSAVIRDSRRVNQSENQGTPVESSPGGGEDEFSTAAQNNALRYIVSAAIPKGTTETKLFNNLYSERTTAGGDDLVNRSTFMTSWLSFLYGVGHRFNVGFDLRYRRVRNDALPASPFDVFAEGGVSSRSGVTTIGPKIRWAPVPKWTNFSIQSALWLPLKEDWEGGVDGEPFLDWNGATWWTQFFNDIPLGSNFSLFAELDFMIEDIGDLNRVSTPGVLIMSYFPNPRTTLYALGGYSPFWQEDYDYFAQGGIGAKYQFTRRFEVELLYTLFTNENLSNTGGDAQTINLGIRFNR